MKKVILCAVLTAFGFNVSAREKKVWEYSDGNLQKVFAIDVSTKSNEILRIYDDGTYEHLKYILKSRGKEEVQRNTGTYKVNRFKINFDAPKEKAFSGKFKYGSFFFNGKIYASLVDMKVKKKNELYRTTEDRKFFKPFFICINSERVVSNQEADEQLDLNRLMDHILKGKESEQDKVMAIVRLIVESVEFDHDGYYKNVYTNDEENVKMILAGSKRLAVCEGYAHTMETLCEIAGISADKVYGNTKQSFADLTQLGGYHAWNMLVINGEKKLYDVTWADDGETIDMRWIDVEPSVMIGTHFPDKIDDQLLASPITKEQFLKSSVLTPTVGSAASIPVEIPARLFAGNNFRLTLPGKHTILAELGPAELANETYGNSANNNSFTYQTKSVGSGHYDGDITYFTIPLTQQINPLEISIDGQVAIKTVVFKGGQTDLMKYYILRANPTNAETYVKGVIAAIRLNDEVTLKKLVGSDNAVFFDKKGKLKIDRSITLACLDWTGELSSLTKTVKKGTTEGVFGETIESEEISYEMEVPDKLKIMLDFDGERYKVTGLETGE
jgi:hypothetical protein